MGPLEGVKVIEIPNIGPMQFAGMLLADLGAEVLRLDRASDAPNGATVGGQSFVSPYSVLDRGRRSAAIDLKAPGAAEIVLRLCEQADVLIEGFRPGVAERLGIGPDACRARNPRLVYGRMTGWGQDGPFANDVGHDINYIALAGALASFGSAGGPPVFPINLIADFGGGGALLVSGILAALLERARSGEGQVIDAAMVDGSAQLLNVFVGLDSMGTWGPRGTNFPDGGAHFYNVYETSDGEWISVGAYEPKFYANLISLMGVADLGPESQMDRERWPELKVKFAEVFKTKTRADWCAVFDGHEVCFAPVLTMTEARSHPHNVARNTFIDVEGAAHPAPAPRFDRTPMEVTRSAVAAGTDTDAALGDWGFTPAEIDDLVVDGVLARGLS
ncbi:MAG TPA: CaiB/BaiF CoA-transferase family protein [Acidimicrobiia bacterium]|nr:CaiB/BaiF CoA-transferase family protein [Acidimicrobiia bacterium]